MVVNGVTCPVTAIADNAFNGDTNLTEIVIPPSVKIIGTNAFEGCTKLKSIRFSGSGLETVGTNAFRGSKITGITFPSSVKELKTGCLSKCDKLKTVVLGAKTVKIAKNAFKGSGVKILKIKAKKVPSPKDIKGVKSLKANATVEVPKAKFKQYKKALAKAGFKGKVKKKG